MHPLLEMKMPLRQFGELYGRQVIEGIRRTPARVNKHMPPLKDLYRVWRAEQSYHKGYKQLYRDYPKEMWG
jgi:hypothetical protein